MCDQYCNRTDENDRKNQGEIVDVDVLEISDIARHKLFKVLESKANASRKLDRRRDG